MNSTEVLKDVQYIWYNCEEYNKKGDNILELIKRVKKYFIKYRKAAGLHMKQTPIIAEPSSHCLDCCIILSLIPVSCNSEIGMSSLLLLNNQLKLSRISSSLQELQMAVLNYALSYEMNSIQGNQREFHGHLQHLTRKVRMAGAIWMFTMVTSLHGQLILDG